MTLFLTALVVGYSGAMMPGPLLTYAIERSLNRGWITGLLVPLGHVLLEMIVVFFLALGLGSFLNNPWPKIVILFVGGLVLLWFGFDMVRSAVKGNLRIDVSGSAAAKRGENLVIMAKSGIISVLNPYFLLWWATVGLGFMLANAKLGVWGIVIFYLGHATADFTWYFAVSLLCSKMTKFISGKPYNREDYVGLTTWKKAARFAKGNAYRIVIGVLGGALGFFAVKFMIDGINLLIKTL